MQGGEFDGRTAMHGTPEQVNVNELNIAHKLVETTFNTGGRICI
jgi:hypothetical protein